MKIFHVSDLHFGADPSSNRDANTLLGHVWTGFDPAVDHLMITGDITANGNEGEYFQAARALSRFQGHLLLVPGNHDYCNWGNDFGEERARRFESHLLAPLGIQHSFLQKDPFVNVLTDGGVRVLTVGLSSNRTNPGVSGFARGVLTGPQLEKLQMALGAREHADCWRVVYLHHQPKIGGDPVDLLEDAERLLKIAHNRVQVLAFGHTCGGPIPNYRPDAGDDALTGPKAGAPYLLNANQSVLRRQYFVMFFDSPARPGEYPTIVLRQPR